LAAEAGEIDGGCWGWDSIKVTWAKGLESGFVRPLIQTTLEPHPDLPNVAVAIQQAKSKEDQTLLRLAAQAYGPASIAYSLPPGLPKDRVQTLQTAFMATMRDAEFLAEANKSNLVVSPLDGPTIEQTVAELYRAEPQAARALPRDHRGVAARALSVAPTRRQSLLLGRKKILSGSVSRML